MKMAARSTFHAFLAGALADPKHIQIEDGYDQWDDLCSHLPSLQGRSKGILPT